MCAKDGTWAGRHISALLKGCTSLSKISGAWWFPSFGHFDFCVLETQTADFQPNEFLTYVNSRHYCPVLDIFYIKYWTLLSVIS